MTKIDPVLKNLTVTLERMGIKDLTRQPCECLIIIKMWYLLRSVDQRSSVGTEKKELHQEESGKAPGSGIWDGSWQMRMHLLRWTSSERWRRLAMWRTFSFPGSPNVKSGISVEKCSNRFSFFSLKEWNIPSRCPWLGILVFLSLTCGWGEQPARHHCLHFRRFVNSVRKTFT